MCIFKKLSLLKPMTPLVHWENLSSKLAFYNKVLVCILLSNWLISWCVFLDERKYLATGNT